LTASGDVEPDDCSTGMFRVGKSDDEDRWSGEPAASEAARIQRLLWFRRETRLWLDLGDVKNLAEVSINGKALGILWKTPYRVDVTGTLKPGANKVEIKVTNPWVNRIIGDRQPNTVKTYRFTSPKYYKADSKLVPSGLLGPVQIIRSKTEGQRQ
jgi:hypothetical protein